MSRKPRTIKPDATIDSFKEAINFVSLVCTNKGPINETHIYIGGGWAAASNDILTIACPIQSELYACPNAHLLQQALSTCGQEYKIEPPFTIISKKFKAIIPCINSILLSISAPNNPVIDLSDGDSLRTGLEIVSVLTSDNAQNIYGASILLNGQSVVATENGVMILEYWHGLSLPIGIAIPKNIVKALSGISKKLTRIGYSERSITLYFEDQSWIKTQLFAEKWPSHVSTVLDRPSNQTPVPKDLWEGLDAVAPFSPDGLVHFGIGSLHSHASEDTGASFDVPGIPAGLIFSARQLMLIKDHVASLDWFTQGPVGPMLTFQGERIRGAIAGRTK